MRLKLILLVVISWFACSSGYAQNQRIIYYLKDSGTLVSTKDSADYWMEVSPPDTGISKFLYVVREYGKNGKVRLQTTSKTNDLNLFYHGKYIAYYPDGRKMRSGEYVNGKFTGIETDYYRNGSVYNIKSYNEDGTIAFVECRDSTGKVLAENGKGVWLEYRSNFKDTSAKGEILNGLMNGKWTGMVNDSLGFANVYLNGKLISHDDIYHYTPYPGKVQGDVFRGKLDKVPGFPGGVEAMYQYLAKTIRYPTAARMNGTQGKVIISFIVDTDGSLTDMKVARGIGDGCDEEAFRVIKGMPKWSPGMYGGKPVKVLYSIPINFAIGR